MIDFILLIDHIRLTRTLNPTIRSFPHTFDVKTLKIVLSRVKSNHYAFIYLKL